MAKSKRPSTSKVTSTAKKNNITNVPKYVTDAMPTGKKRKKR
jgi:hypothetical protein